MSTAIRPTWAEVDKKKRDAERDGEGDSEESQGAFEVPQWEGAEVPRGLTVAFPAVINVKLLGELSEPALAGRSFSTLPHREAKVKRVRFYGADGRVVARVEIEGSIPGSLYLVGDMRLIEDERLLVLENVEYTDASRVAASQLYDEYQQRDFSNERVYWFDGEGLRLAVEEAVRWPVGEFVAERRRAVEAAIEGISVDPFRLEAITRRASVATRTMGREALRLLAVSEGELYLLAPGQELPDPEPDPDPEPQTESNENES